MRIIYIDCYFHIKTLSHPSESGTIRQRHCAGPDRTKRLYYSKIPNLPDERNCNVALAGMEKGPQAYAYGPFIYPVNPVFSSLPNGGRPIKDSYKHTELPGPS